MIDISAEYGIYTKKCKVFLGGTCTSNWRDKFIPMLKLDYFNPVVKNWTHECIAIENEEKHCRCDFQLYVITPKMEGCYSIAEVTDSSNKIPKRTIFCMLNKDEGKTFSKSNRKSLEAVKSLLIHNGAHVFDTLKECADFLNQFLMEE
jgi:hypothetical protein